MDVSFLPHTLPTSFPSIKKSSCCLVAFATDVTSLFRGKKVLQSCKIQFSFYRLSIVYRKRTPYRRRGIGNGRNFSPSIPRRQATIGKFRTQDLYSSLLMMQPKLFSLFSWIDDWDARRDPWDRVCQVFASIHAVSPVLFGLFPGHDVIVNYSCLPFAGLELDQ